MNQSKNAQIKEVSPSVNKGEELTSAFARDLQKVVQLLRQTLQSQAERVQDDRTANIVQTAIELAKLNGAKDPRDYVSQAARLTLAASTAISDEIKRQDLASEEQELESIEAEIEMDLVPFDRLYRPGKTDGGNETTGQKEHFEFWKPGEGEEEGKTVKFTWLVFISKGGLKERLLAHSDRINSELSSKMEVELQKTTSNFQRALSIPQTYFMTKELEEKRSNVHTRDQARNFIKTWYEQAVPAVFEKLWEDAQAGRLNLATVYEIYETRKQGYESRFKLKQ